MSPADASAPPRGSLPRYRSTLSYGWVLGDFAIRELIRHAPETVLDVRWHGDLALDRRTRLADMCAAIDAPFRRDDATVEAKRSKGTARVLACFAKRNAALATDRDQLVLLDPTDPGNLGTMLRTALAFGVEDVAIVGAGDPWSPHATRASLGAIFALRTARFASIDAYLASAPNHDVVRLDGHGDGTLDDLAGSDAPLALLAGPAWPGFRPEQRRYGRAVGIELDPRVESLNVAVAVGIALQRRSQR